MSRGALLTTAIFIVGTLVTDGQVPPFPRPLAIPAANQAASAAAAGRPFPGPMVPMVQAGPMMLMAQGGPMMPMTQARPMMPMAPQQMAPQPMAPQPATPPKVVATRAQLRNQEVWRADVGYMASALLTVSSIYFWVLSKVQRSLDGGSRVVLVPKKDSPLPLETLGWVLDALADYDPRHCIDAFICTLTSSSKTRRLTKSQKVIVKLFGSMREFVTVSREMPRARFAIAANLGRQEKCGKFVRSCPIDVRKEITD